MMKTTRIKAIFQTVHCWFNSSANPVDTASNTKAIDWVRTIPFTLLHLACFAIIWVGASPVAVWAAVILYLLRMFAITAFYHRYFSHKSFRASRFMQFLFAVAGASAAQRGPLWWAAHHRVHHASSDGEKDPHSPVMQSFFWSHMAWFLCRENFKTRLDKITDFARYPELRFLDRYDMLVPTLLGIFLYTTGLWLEQNKPELGTTAWQFFIWSFVISTVACYHATFTVNSLAHRWGKKVFPTGDDSRNNPIIALLTLGEGWHNNHHYFPASARQGFVWWEVDITWYGLLLMEKLGMVSNIRPVPDRVIANRHRTGQEL